VSSRALTRSVVVSLLEPTGERRAGNAILNLAYTWGAAIGPAVAGLVVAKLNVPTALLLDAGSFCAMGLLLLSCRGLPHPETEEGSLRERVRAGIGHIRDKATLRRLLIAQAAAFIFFSAVIPVEVIFAKETLGVGDTGYGIMLASWGAGMVIGGFAFAFLRRAPLPVLLFISTIAVGISYLGIGLSPTLLAACAASVVGGVGNGVQWVGVISAVQELTAAKMQARVLSVLESIGAAMPGVGFLLGGVIAASFGPRATFFVAGAGVLAIVAAAAPSLGTKWSEHMVTSNPNELDARDEIVLELLPGSRSVQSNPEVLP
jgi:predicted MFS family arabinose efflux permease